MRGLLGTWRTTTLTGRGSRCMTDGKDRSRGWLSGRGVSARRRLARAEGNGANDGASKRVGEECGRRGGGGGGGGGSWRIHHEHCRFLHTIRLPGTPFPTAKEPRGRRCGGAASPEWAASKHPCRSEARVKLLKATMAVLENSKWPELGQQDIRQYDFSLAVTPQRSRQRAWRRAETSCWSGGNYARRPGFHRGKVSPMVGKHSLRA